MTLLAGFLPSFLLIACTMYMYITTSLLHVYHYITLTCISLHHSYMYITTSLLHVYHYVTLTCNLLYYMYITTSLLHATSCITYISLRHSYMQPLVLQVAVMKLDQDQRGSAPFHTSTRGVPPPLVTTDFTVIDDGEQRVNLICPKLIIFHTL